MHAKLRTQWLVRIAIDLGYHDGRRAGKSPAHNLVIGGKCLAVTTPLITRRTRFAHATHAQVNGGAALPHCFTPEKNLNIQGHRIRPGRVGPCPRAHRNSCRSTQSPQERQPPGPPPRPEADTAHALVFFFLPINSVFGSWEFTIIGPILNIFEYC